MRPLAPGRALPVTLPAALVHLPRVGVERDRQLDERPRRSREEVDPQLLVAAIGRAQLPRLRGENTPRRGVNVWMKGEACKVRTRHAEV